MPASPRTAAGRALLAELLNAYGSLSIGDGEAILAIEAEAAQQASPPPPETRRSAPLDVETLILTLYDEIDHLHRANAVFEDGDPAISARIGGVKFAIGKIKEYARLAPAQAPNHYDWFMPANPQAAVDEYLDDFEAKLREALTDPYVHDMAQSVLPLIAAYRQARPADAALREALVWAIEHGEESIAAIVDPWELEYAKGKVAVLRLALRQQPTAAEDA